MISKEKVEEIMLNAGLTVDLTSPIPGDVGFDDLGLDSLDVFNVFVELESLTGIKVPDEDIGKLQTIDNILEYFQSRET